MATTLDLPPPSSFGGLSCLLDANWVAVSPSSVYRVLKQAGLMDRWNGKTSKKGTGFVQPLQPHDHWHIDISYLNLAGTFYYMCSILDGQSQAIIHWAPLLRKGPRSDEGS